MQSYTNKIKEDKSYAASGELHKQSIENKSLLQLKDNRPQSVLQKKQVEAMANRNANYNQEKDKNSSDQGKSDIENHVGYSLDNVKPQLNSDNPVQLKSTIEHTSGQYKYGAGLHETVGTSMHAWLDLNDPVDGSETAQNANVQHAMMQSVGNAVVPPMVRGHLLNAHLGGDAVAPNLYPITLAANNQHKSKVEYGVKAQVQAGGAEYQVDVINAQHNQAHPAADFKCRAWAWAPNAWFGRGPEILNVTIQSHPNVAPNAGAIDNNNPGAVPGNFPFHVNPAGWTTSAPGAHGRVGRNRVAFHGGGCYITTAVTEAKGLPDNCKELTTLRSFRDKYMAALPDGKKMIADYYALAPKILIKLQQMPNYKEIMHGLSSKINECVALIESGRHEQALEEYKSMVAKLKATYL